MSYASGGASLLEVEHCGGVRVDVALPDLVNTEECEPSPMKTLSQSLVAAQLDATGKASGLVIRSSEP